MLHINRKAAQHHMRETQHLMCWAGVGIAGICPGPNLSRRNAENHVYPYLLRHLAITTPNQVWGIDITYIRLRAGWMYLVAVLDWYSRYVLSWELDDVLEIPFVLRCAQSALAQATPVIWNSDQGSHFTSPQYTQPLLAAGVQLSMDGRGRALDNIFTERLWRTVKYEEVYLNEYATPREARQRLASYFKFYNHERPHTCTCSAGASVRRSTTRHRRLGTSSRPPRRPWAVDKWTTEEHRCPLIHSPDDDE